MSAEPLAGVGERIRALGLSTREAARRIGVTEDSLVRHLAGEYVRSDSLAKYRVWLNGGGAASKESQLELLRGAPVEKEDPDAPLRALRLIEPPRPDERYRVIDLFSGCGGLSLGFDLMGDGRHFDTVLALDIERAMVETLNRNAHREAPGDVARCVDLSEFLNESEVRAFYLDHLTRVEPGTDLDAQLESLLPVGLPCVVEAVRRVDALFLRQFDSLRREPRWQQAYGALDSRALGQTSVVGFHNALKLPLPSSRDLGLEPMLWNGSPQGEGLVEEGLEKAFVAHWLQMEATVRGALERRWSREIVELERRSEGVARGQLASSAARIKSFLAFLNSVPELKDLWLGWRARRDSLRFIYFGHPEIEEGLKRLYSEGYAASVILGGPPCQGFSRIGRGKLRSLRDDRVQVHYDEEAGDLRNRLFEKYVLFVEALAPSAFLFENVRHFQTEVKTPEGTFLATEVLAEAVRSLSGDGLHYEVASRTVLASDHGIPQTRERFFMAGVRSDLAAATDGVDAPAWILALPRVDPVPLRAALDDLPDPWLVGEAGLEATVSVPPQMASPTCSAETRYKEWVRQPHPRGSGWGGGVNVDSHIARDHRADDRAWFSMMGPGKRWMDYRCDDSPTVNRLREALQAAAAALASVDGVDDQGALASELEELAGISDGALSLRLLLEGVPRLPGELSHHLAKETYLKKREGNHGDWLARLDPTKPCRTVVTHMGKDTYAYIHPWRAGSLSVREAARIQAFPDWYSFGNLGLVDAFRVIGNAVPPLLSVQFADRITQLLCISEQREQEATSQAAAS